MWPESQNQRLEGTSLEVSLLVSQSVLQMRKFQDGKGLSCGHRTDKRLRAGGGALQGGPPTSISAESSASVEQAPGVCALPGSGPPLLHIGSHGQ